MERKPVDFVYWQPSYDWWTVSEASKENKRKYEVESLPMYIVTHKDIPEDISNGFKLRRVVRGMNREQVRLILGEPQEIKDQAGREVWWYYKNTGLGCLLQPVLLPFCLISPAFYEVSRKEIYWEKDRVKDLQEYRPTGPLMALP